MMRTHLNVSAGKILTAALCLFQAFALSPPRFGGRPSQPSALTFLRASKAAPSAQPFLEPSVQVRAMKLLLLDAIQNFRNQQAIDGTVSVDFGVKGGELNATSRAPQTVDYYAVSEDLGKAADGVKDVCALLSKENPSDEPTALLGDKINGALAPLNGDVGATVYDRGGRLLFEGLKEGRSENSKRRGWCAGDRYKRDRIRRRGGETPRSEAAGGGHTRYRSLQVEGGTAIPIRQSGAK
eukprot:CAMPEP_0194325622 /NCGR_PEP_ID=MMETSP0171-20130528/31919_1 /TAXON_ID=218684 /ORGANISM="Corethron pennatum, Strain L29A3" /LENGTH=238 /DNA_ID=CAMNT_0039084837 /DNA_START=42 /DNA_END=757 /DNA_ORIENTATION=+